MKRDRKIKRAVLYHLASGAALSVMLFALVQTHRYCDRVRAGERYIMTIGQQALRMEQATRAMAARRAEALRAVPAGYENKSHREIALAALPKVSEIIPGARITVENFRTENDELALPVKIEFGTVLYGAGVETVARLEDMRFPYFLPVAVSVKKQDDGTGLEWKVEGSFRMPAENVGDKALEARR